jgi:hypothetical protein
MLIIPYKAMTESPQAIPAVRIDPPPPAQETLDEPRDLEPDLSQENHTEQPIPKPQMEQQAEPLEDSPKKEKKSTWARLFSKTPKSKPDIKKSSSWFGKSERKKSMSTPNLTEEDPESEKGEMKRHSSDGNVAVAPETKGGTKFSNYNRLPLHVERTIYKQSHQKLAQHNRPLLHQVLISNMLFWYMNQMRSNRGAYGSDDEDEDRAAFQRSLKETRAKNKRRKRKAAKEAKKKESPDPVSDALGGPKSPIRLSVSENHLSSNSAAESSGDEDDVPLAVLQKQRTIGSPTLPA